MSNIPIFGTLAPNTGSPLPIVDGGGNKIVNVANPTVGSDVATKSYVDAVAQGLSPKGAALALYSANVATLSGAPGATDGVTPSTGDTVFLNAQTTASQNGPWVTAAGAWTRPANFANGAHAASAFFFIEEGTDFGDTGWVCSTDPPNDVIGANALAFVQFSSAGVVLADEVTLHKSGNTLSVKSGGIGDTQVSGFSVSKLLAGAALLGQALIFNGSAYAPGTDFGAQNITTTGAIKLGTNPASAGDLRINHGYVAKGRNNVNSADFQLWDWGSSAANTLTIGNSGTVIAINAASVVNFIVGGGTFLFQPTQLQLATNIASLQFSGAGISTATLNINATAAAGATGVPLNIGAQDSTGTGATVGGKLLLRSGTGATIGALQLQAGTTLSLLDYNVTTANALTLGGSALTQITLAANTLVQFSIGGGVTINFAATNVTFGNSVTALHFSNAATIDIISTAVAAVTGSTLAVQAQDATGSGSTVGGKLSLRSGLGNTNGSVQISRGTTGIFDYNVTTLGQVTLGNTVDGVTINGNGVTIANTGGVYIFRQTAFECATGIDTIQFSGASIAAANLKVTSTAVAVATGLALNITAQDSTGTGATVGGKLLLRSGTGATAGNFEIRAGAATLFDWGVTRANTITIGIGGSVLNLNHTSGGLGLFQGGAGYAVFTSTQAQFPTNYNIKLLNGGTISCSTTAIAGATGGPLNLIATDTTGTGATVGGKMLVRSGTGATAGALQLLTGSASVLNALPGTSITLGDGTSDLIYNANNASGTEHKFQAASTTIFTVGTSGISAQAQLFTFLNTSAKISFNTAPGTFTSGTLATLTLQGQSGGGTTGTYTTGSVLVAGGDVPGGGSATAHGGDVILRGGNGGAASVNGNIAIGGTSANWQGMANGMFIANDNANPTGNPTNGGFLFVDAGALKYRGSSGTVTTLAAA